VRTTASGLHFEEIGTDEIQLIPTSSDIEQLHRAADVAARI
jgi:hypothetical protein